MTPPPTHKCIKDEQIQHMSRKLERVDAKVDYKDKRLDIIEEKIDKLNETVNQLMLKSVTDDNDINNRVTALESSQQTIYRIISLVSVALALFTFYLNYIR